MDGANKIKTSLLSLVMYVNAVVANRYMHMEWGEMASLDVHSKVIKKLLRRRPSFAEIIFMCFCFEKKVSVSTFGKILAKFQ